MQGPNGIELRQHILLLAAIVLASNTISSGVLSQSSVVMYRK